MTNKKGPLAGLRVLDFGHFIAGPLAGVFLADQGAEVIQVRNPRARMWDSNTEATLARGKRSVDADLRELTEQQRILALAAECDVVLENFRPGVMERLGLGYETVLAVNPGVIYVSMPGYSRHDPRAHLPVWDGTINAASGLYTDLSIGGVAVDLPPAYTPLTLPSVYAGLWGAISTLAALYARQSHGHGDRIEVPLMDAAMSAAAGVIFQIADQPARYNAPPVSRRWLDRISLRRLPAGIAAKTHDLVGRMMPPLFRNYVCGDDQQLFLCAIDNANHIAKLVAVMGRFPLPVEVIPMAAQQIARRFAALGGSARLRLKDGVPLVTDNGQHILDVTGLQITDPLAFESQVNNWPGVVTVGVFAHQKAHVCLLGTASGVKTFEFGGAA